MDRIAQNARVTNALLRVNNDLIKELIKKLAGD